MKTYCSNKALGVCELCKVALAGFESRDEAGKTRLVCRDCVDHPGMRHVRVLGDVDQEDY